MQYGPTQTFSWLRKAFAKVKVPLLMCHQPLYLSNKSMDMVEDGVCHSSGFYTGRRQFKITILSGSFGPHDLYLQGTTELARLT